jgi:hypothetical protein
MPKVKITHYKSYRGRPNGTESEIVDCEIIKVQNEWRTLVKLLTPVFGFKAGHMISVNTKDIKH